MLVRVLYIFLGDVDEFTFCQIALWLWTCICVDSGKRLALFSDFLSSSCSLRSLTCFRSLGLNHRLVPFPRQYLVGVFTQRRPVSVTQL